jgi:hypothetical protein
MFECFLLPAGASARASVTKALETQATTIKAICANSQENWTPDNVILCKKRLLPLVALWRMCHIRHNTTSPIETYLW